MKEWWAGGGKGEGKRGMRWGYAGGQVGGGEEVDSRFALLEADVNAKMGIISGGFVQPWRGRTMVFLFLFRLFV